MKIIQKSAKNFAKSLSSLCQRRAYPPEIENGVREIIEAVRKKGDSAIAKFAKKFDRATLSPDKFIISPKEIEEAREKVNSDIKQAVKNAISNIANFAAHGIQEDWIRTFRNGVKLGERFVPYSAVGVYVPGGTAPLISTAIHTITIAKTAGVERIVAASPPRKDGTLLPEMIYAMSEAGATEIYRIGGAYAIAALAYGTKTIKKVEKIVGPGNAFVTAAKKLVYGDVSIDMVAGPSEIMIIVEKGSNAEFIAADALSQAEHGSGLEQVVILSDDVELLHQISAAVKVQAKTLPRSESISKVLKNGFFLVEVADMNEAAKIASEYAPEHLEIHASQPELIAAKVKAAGAIFLGKWTPEPVGDFCAGPSHVLPTGGSAKYFSGLRTEDFFRRISILEYSRDALAAEIPTIAKFAETEGLAAHGRSAQVRFEEL